MKNIILLPVFLLLTTMLFSQDRNIMWLHGMGENGQSLDELEEGIINTHSVIDRDNSPGYRSRTGADEAYQDIRPDILNQPENNTLLIGHSMGGLIARHATTLDNRNMRGVVTIGTPNHGASIANSVLNGTVENAAEVATEKLTAGPLSSLLGGFSVSGIVMAHFANRLFGNIARVIIGDVVENQVDQSTIDLATNSEYINRLNAGESRAPIVSIWGNERSPVHWRLLSSLTGDNDTRMVNTVDKIRSVYNTVYYTKLSVGVVSTIFSFFNPTTFVIATKNYYQASQWKKGVNWIDRSESTYNTLIDCRGNRFRTETIIVQRRVCKQVHPRFGCAETGIVYDEEVTLQIPTNDASDGFICEDSQIYDRAIDSYEAVDANHIEEMNHPAVITQLSRVFNRIDGFGIEER